MDYSEGRLSLISLVPSLPVFSLSFPVPVLRRFRLACLPLISCELSLFLSTSLYWSISVDLSQSIVVHRSPHLFAFRSVIYYRILLLLMNFRCFSPLFWHSPFFLPVSLIPLLLPRFFLFLSIRFSGSSYAHLFLAVAIRVFTLPATSFLLAAFGLSLIPSNFYALLWPLLLPLLTSLIFLVSSAHVFWIFYSLDIALYIF